MSPPGQATVGVAAGAAIRALDTRAVELAAQRSRASALLLRDVSAAIGRPAPVGWSGAGRAAYDVVRTELGSRTQTWASALETVALALTALAETLRSVQAEGAAAARILAGAGAFEVAEPVSRQLEAAGLAFADADRRAAALLWDALTASPVGRSPGNGPLLPVPLRARAFVRDVSVPPAVPSSPPAVALWWAGLPAAARSALQKGAAIGGLDGVPAPVRDGINRRRLADALHEALHEATRADVRSRGGQLARELTVTASRVLPWPFAPLVKALAGKGRQAAHLAELRALTRTLALPGSELLLFDADYGEAVVASGDVDTSRSVAVLVPGMSSDLADVPGLVGEGGRLAGAAGNGTVSVAWLGYAAPGLRQVVSDSRAKSGAVNLRRFTEGLRSAAARRQRLTVVGHSYGTLVAGIAARGGLRCDDLVLLASPGVEADRASQLRLAPGRVWAARAGTDPIRVVFWPSRVEKLFGLPVSSVFGPDPAAPAFGARHFAVTGANGHSGYFTAGSRSLDNLGRIVSGRPVLP